jgi:hypothetical protein
MVMYLICELAGGHPLQHQPAADAGRTRLRQAHSQPSRSTDLKLSDAPPRSSPGLAAAVPIRSITAVAQD